MSRRRAASIVRVRALAIAGRLAIATALVATRAAAQQVVRVRVTDTTGAAVSDADVALLHGAQTVLVHGASDTSGVRVLTGALGRGEVSLVVRKIGYARVDRFLTLGGRDTLGVDVMLHALPTTLAAVTVDARRDALRARYHIDADAIASSHTVVLDALDVVTRLRPDMIYGARGDCGAVNNVWVNGDRILNIVPDPALQQRQAMLEQARRDARVSLPLHGAGAVPINVSTVLAAIHPEHIAEITFHDCSDLSLQKVGSAPALFIVLKPGIKYLPTQGSCIAPTRTAKRAAPARTLTFGGDTLARFRLRLLGVFDAATGEPLPGVHVTDVATGADATTTSTGTVSLYFLRPGANTVRLAHEGYRTVELPVTIAPADTIPITALLAKP